MGITEQFVKLAATDVPEAVAAMVRLSFFDWAACGIAGAADDRFAPFRRAQLIEEGPAQVFGGDATGAASAALLNGTFGHALDFDDMHFAFMGRPSAAVFPAVIALAETLDTRLTDAVDAAAIGMEAAIMAGLWLGRGHRSAGFEQTATAGAFGATLACARLLELDKAQIRNALGICASMASGLGVQAGTMTQPLHAGLAARTGVEAALWAQTGLSAAPDALDGPKGFARTHQGDLAEVKAPRKEWYVTTISHKFHACCHGLHAMLEALSGCDVQADRISGIRIRTHPYWMDKCNIAAPKTGQEAQNSLTHAAAMKVLGHSTQSLDDFSGAVARDASVCALRDRIDVMPDEKLGVAQSLVTLTLDTGEVRRLRHDLDTQVTLEALADRLLKKAPALITQEKADSLWQAVIGPDLDAVTACFNGG
ncbi:MmgE/PrpD family protein [Sulfitobacter sp. F26169L]|uniref:MmgE/PrpD family protein n=1 Tax=Sulfitobacter sp. F26169L TaxID=2996015 RepID=UPI0022609888|nr:MmgE/PrpD family protein [Sulfitobacter sp. F26169L]MCX7565374.1 MmgE/PrpD family protein [Sulfitobacter sp. F26169L]